MADDRRREIDRHYKGGADLGVTTAWLLQRARSGELPLSMLELACYCDCPEACSATGQSRFKGSPLEWARGLAEWGKMPVVIAALAYLRQLPDAEVAWWPEVRAAVAQVEAWVQEPSEANRRTSYGLSRRLLFRQSAAPADLPATPRVVSYLAGTAGTLGQRGVSAPVLSARLLVAALSECDFSDQMSFQVHAKPAVAEWALSTTEGHGS